MPAAYQLLSGIDNYTIGRLSGSTNVVDYWRNNPPRSLLFVPADRAARFLAAADASATDGLIFDLEDAVAEGSKEHARDQLVELLQAERPRHPFFVRVNSAPGDRLERDIAVAVRLDACGVVLPKARRTADMRKLLRCSRTQKFARTADGSPYSHCSSHQVQSSMDRLSPRQTRALWGWALALRTLPQTWVVGVRTVDSSCCARSQVVLAAAAAGCWALDPPPMDVHDETVARREARQARRLGFVGKFVIHPRQVPVVNAAFTPDENEVAWARRVVDALHTAHEHGGGTATVDGRLADEPTLRLARRILSPSDQAR
jgi:citrate lyase subunit beta/citryl-CoA lyase